MKIHDVAQNSPEWRMLRAGIPTASAFEKIITPKGAASKSAESYKNLLLGERIMGHPADEKPFSWAMERGSALEKKALTYYQIQTDYQTVPVGFVTDDDERWGASPDQFVGDDGCLEIKCPEKIELHISYLRQAGAAYEDYKVQAQGQLWVCDRQWVDFLSFHPDLPWSLVRVERDESYIEKLEKAVRQFSDELEALAVEAKEKGWFRRDSVREPKFSQDTLMQAMRDSLIAVQKGAPCE